MNRCIHMGPGVVKSRRRKRRCRSPGPYTQVVVSRGQDAARRLRRRSAAGKHSRRAAQRRRRDHRGGSGKEALEAAQARAFDCIVVDRTLRDMSATDFLRKFTKTQRAAKFHRHVRHGRPRPNEQDKLRSCRRRDPQDRQHAGSVSSRPRCSCTRAWSACLAGRASSWRSGASRRRSCPGRKP